MAESAKKPTAAFRDEHRDLLVHVEQIRLAASEVTELAFEERETVVGRVLEFLRNTLVPHAEWEEQALYTAVGELLEIYLPLLDARPDVAERVMKQIGAHHASP